MDVDQTTLAHLLPIRVSSEEDASIIPLFLKNKPAGMEWSEVQMDVLSLTTVQLRVLLGAEMELIEKLTVSVDPSVTQPWIDRGIADIAMKIEQDEFAAARRQRREEIEASLRTKFQGDLQEKWFVVRNKSSKKFSDGMYGWDGTILDEVQIFRRSEIPYKANEAMEFILVGEGRKPSLDVVRKLLETKAVADAGVNIDEDEALPTNSR